MAIIQRLNGKTFDLKKLGIRTKDIAISAPVYRHVTEEIEGRSGYVDMGSTLGPRTITADFRATAVDIADFPLMRDEIFNLFRSDEPFYFIEKRNPGKRWLVKVTNSYDLEQQYVYGDFQLQMTCNRGLVESIGTTLTPFEWDADKWQWGMGIPYDDYSYEHSTNQFTIYNAGTEIVDPRNMELKIILKGIATQFVEIRNNTTGDVYRYNGKLNLSDTLVLDRIRSTKNSLSVFRDTNKKLITLAPGPNEFEVLGITVERISFDFPFYYV